MVVAFRMVHIAFFDHMKKLLSDWDKGMNYPRLTLASTTARLNVLN
jgi:hypothetical protein